MIKRPLRVLVACERSQVVRDAFERAGCVAWSLDIEPCYGQHPEKHIISDAYTFPLSGWDLIIAHPPCTVLTRCANAHINDPGRVQLVVRALRLWARFLFESPCPVAVENPVGIPCSILPPSQIVQPYYFGEPFQKETCLWLRGLPPLFHTCECVRREKWVDTSKTAGVAQKVTGIKDRSMARSHFFPGIAAAMAEQWVPYLVERGKE